MTPDLEKRFVMPQQGVRSMTVVVIGPAFRLGRCKNPATVRAKSHGARTASEIGGRGRPSISTATASKASSAFDGLPAAEVWPEHEMDLFHLPRVLSFTGMESNRSSTLCVIPAKCGERWDQSSLAWGTSNLPEPSPRPARHSWSSRRCRRTSPGPRPTWLFRTVHQCLFPPVLAVFLDESLSVPADAGFVLAMFAGPRRLSLLGGCPRCPHTSAKAFRSGATAPPDVAPNKLIVDDGEVIDAQAIIDTRPPT